MTWEWGSRCVCVCVCVWGGGGGGGGSAWGFEGVSEGVCYKQDGGVRG